MTGGELNVSILESNSYVVRPEGLEPPAYWFEASRSIQLSYGRGSWQLAYSHMLPYFSDVSLLPGDPGAPRSLASVPPTRARLFPGDLVARFLRSFPQRTPGPRALSGRVTGQKLVNGRQGFPHTVHAEHPQ